MTHNANRTANGTGIRRSPFERRPDLSLLRANAVRTQNELVRKDGTNLLRVIYDTRVGCFFRGHAGAGWQSPAADLTAIPSMQPFPERAKREPWSTDSEKIVIPAEAGIHVALLVDLARALRSRWIPACAGDASFRAGDTYLAPGQLRRACQVLEFFDDARIGFAPRLVQGQRALRGVARFAHAMRAREGSRFQCQHIEA